MGAFARGWELAHGPKFEQIVEIPCHSPQTTTDRRDGGVAAAVLVQRAAKRNHDHREADWQFEIGLG